MANSLKEQAVKGTGWSAIERFATQGISFLIQLVLARLLMPEDYGVIAMLAIFLQIAQVFIDSGFANALINKLDCSEIDYSTVFYYNLAVAVIIYLILFISAPFVARFYEVHILANVMRVISITLVINALCIVQRTILVKRLDFKSQTIVSILSVVVSGAFGIYLAYKGFGVWALCAQTILNSLFQFILLTFYVRWRPLLVFSYKSFNDMFGYGSKLLGASLISVVYSNLYTIVIGKRFSSETLGYYSRADQFVKFPSTNIAAIISKVSLPVLSLIQNETEKLTYAYRQVIKYSSYVIFPLMIGLIAVAKPFIIVVLSEKWAGVIPIMQILCLGFMVDHLSLLNLNLLYVKGRTDLVLKLEIIKKAIAITILFATLPFGVITMCWGKVTYDFIAVLINSYYTKKLINLSIVRQYLDILPYFIASLIMFGVVIFINHFIENYTLQLFVGVVSGGLFYALVSLLFFRVEVKDLMSMVWKARK